MLLVYKFTVYSLSRPPYNQFHDLEDSDFDVNLGHENLFVWFHQLDDIIIEIIDQNDAIAISQFIGERWGI